MKKIMFLAGLALFGAAHAQKSGNFELGAHLGLPVGDSSNAFNFTLGADAAYVWNLSTSFDLGIETGYSHYIGKNVQGGTVPSLGLVPLVATARFNMTGGFNIGVDLGYGFITGKWADYINGGFYYQPKIGYHFGQGNLYLGYQGVGISGKNGLESLGNGSLNAINLGYAHKF